jgi:hypothetical protein
MGLNLHPRQFLLDHVLSFLGTACSHMPVLLMACQTDCAVIDRLTCVHLWSLLIAACDFLLLARKDILQTMASA